jgi:hypothetical protein
MQHPEYTIVGSDDMHLEQGREQRSVLRLILLSQGTEELQAKPGPRVWRRHLAIDPVTSVIAI